MLPLPLAPAIALWTLAHLLAIILSFFPGLPALVAVIARIVFCGRRRRAGEHSGFRFPISVEQLTRADMETMLRAHLEPDVHVVSVRPTGNITDGVKGDKAVLEVEYSAATALPTQFFVKFQLQANLPVRLLCEATEAARIEAHFYNRVADRLPTSLRAPRCFFCDHCAATGEFILLTELVDFGAARMLPSKHRVRDATTLDEQRLFVQCGAELNASLWGRRRAAELGLPRYDETRQAFFALAQIIGVAGLRKTTAKRLVAPNDAFMTWRVPDGVAGREFALIRDLPRILTSLVADRRYSRLVAFGHSDLFTDNAFVERMAWGELKLGLFDWQQATANNVGQEWAWNFHFLPPEFLTAHEDGFIELLLQTWRRQGHIVERAEFCEAYALGALQMYVFSGGSMPTLAKKLHARGLWASLRPGDARCADASLPRESVELLVGAELTRRAFTNACNIMQRHGFAKAWARWRQ